MGNNFWVGVLFIIIGSSLIYYLKTKTESQKKPWDLKGYVGGISSIIFGIYLIYQCLILKDCHE